MVAHSGATAKGMRISIETSSCPEDTCTHHRYQELESISQTHASDYRPGSNIHICIHLTSSLASTCSAYISFLRCHPLSLEVETVSTRYLYWLYLEISVTHGFLHAIDLRQRWTIYLMLLLARPSVITTFVAEKAESRLREAD